MGAAPLLTAAVAEPARFRSLTPAIPPTVWRWRADQARVYELAARQVERWGGARWSELTYRPPSSPALDPDQPALPPVVAEDLTALLPEARLEVARSLGEVATWPDEVGDFIGGFSGGVAAGPTR